MKNKIILISLIISTTFLGCSLQDVTISKNIREPQIIPETSKSIDTDSKCSEKLTESEINDVTLRPDMGEKFAVESLVTNGTLYATITSADVYSNLNAAGINEDDTLPYSLLNEGEPRIENDKPVYDKKTGDMLNDWKIVKLHIKIENVDAISSYPDPTNKYKDDVFSASSFNVCNTDNSTMTNSMNYFCYRQIYFSLSGEFKEQPALYTCSHGQTVEYDVAYIFDCDPEYLYFSTTSGNKTNTMVKLNLGDE